MAYERELKEGGCRGEVRMNGKDRNIGDSKQREADRD